MTEGSQSRILVVDDVRESALITRALLARDGAAAGPPVPRPRLVSSSFESDATLCGR